MDVNNIPSILATALSAGAVAAGGVLYSLTRSPVPLKWSNVDYDLMSKQLDEEGFTRTSIYSNKENKNVNWYFENNKTCYDIFLTGMKRAGQKPCLGYKKDAKDSEYHFYTYNEIDKMSCDTGAGIIGCLKQASGQSTKIGIMMRNCVEWILLEQACNRYSIIPVPLYDTLGEDACVFIINDTRMEVLFVDTIKKLQFILRHKTEFKYLKYIVMRQQSSEAEELMQNAGFEFYFFQQILDYGKENPVPINLVGVEDVYTICYTSGTTGLPKGCVMTHGKFANIVSTGIPYLELIEFGLNEVHFSFLPLTHIYERLAQALFLLYGGKIMFFTGEISMLLDEMKAVKPTIMFAVPRLMNRIYDKVMIDVNKSKVTKYLFEKGLSYKVEEINRGIIRKNSIWDYLIFKKIQQALGGQIKLILVGSAPISSTTLQFFRAAIGCVVIEGYGQTETMGPCTMTFPGDHDTGQVGPPVPGVIVRLIDVPELDLVVKRDQRGEICIKGESIISEYFNNPEMTNKLIDKEGWLHTGDVGQWTEKGQLKIVDRCKHIFKLSQGEYLAPERLENIYTLSPLISQVYVTGNSLCDYCVALVLPDLEGWNSSCEDRGSKSQASPNRKKFNSELEMFQEQDNQQWNIRSTLLKEMQTVGRANGLMGFEIVKKISLLSEPMTTDNGLLTPTLKLKRAVAKKRYEKEVNELYDECK